MVNIITWPVIRDDGRSDGGDVDNIILYLSLPTSGCTVYYDNVIITEDLLGRCLLLGQPILNLLCAGNRVHFVSI